MFYGKKPHDENLRLCEDGDVDDDNDGLCKDESTNYQDCAWGSCRYLNGIGTASDLPNYTDIDCYSDLRLHAFESKMDASWITHNTLCNKMFSLFPAYSVDNSMQKAIDQKIYTLNNCPEKL